MDAEFCMYCRGEYPLAGFHGPPGARVCLLCARADSIGKKHTAEWLAMGVERAAELVDCVIPADPGMIGPAREYMHRAGLHDATAPLYIERMIELRQPFAAESVVAAWRRALARVRGLPEPVAVSLPGLFDCGRAGVAVG